MLFSSFHVVSVKNIVGFLPWVVILIKLIACYVCSVKVISDNEHTNKIDGFFRLARREEAA